MKPPVWFERPILPGLAEEVTARVHALGPWATAADAQPSNAVGVVAGSRAYGAAFMDAAPRLLAIARTGIGVDTVDIPEASRRGIAVCNAPDGPTVSTAEHAVMLLMMVAKNCTSGIARLRAGVKDPFAQHDGLELKGKTLGLVGCGRIARRVAGIASAIGMDIVAYDPFVTDFPAPVTPAASLEDLLAQADAVSVHVPLTAETRHLFNDKTFAAVRPGAIFVNTARGGLVDQQALLDAIDRGHLWGAGLDVTTPEPLPADHPLLHRDNVVVTPHVAAGTREAKHNNFMAALDQVIQVAKGERPEHLVNPEAWDRVHDRWQQDGAS